MDKESTGRIVIPKGITRSGMKNLPKEWDFTGNYKLLDKKSTRRMGFYRELLAHGCRLRPLRSKCAKNPPNGDSFRISNSKS
jgi:hypothetical protein